MASCASASRSRACGSTSECDSHRASAEQTLRPAWSPSQSPGDTRDFFTFTIAPGQPGTYSYVLQQTGTQLTRYSIEFIVAPEPAAPVLIGSAVVVAAVHRRRTRRVAVARNRSRRSLVKRDRASRPSRTRRSAPRPPPPFRRTNRPIRAAESRAPPAGRAWPARSGVRVASRACMPTTPTLG